MSDASLSNAIGFQDGNVSHEHIYWDQAAVLCQLGLLDRSISGVG